MKRRRKKQQSALIDIHEDAMPAVVKHEPGVHKSVDYLTLQRLKRAEQEGLYPKRLTEAQQIDKLLADAAAHGLSEFERVELVRRRAEIMEQRAMREEQLIRNATGGYSAAGVEQVIAVNDRYIDAITAKLKILD